MAGAMKKAGYAVESFKSDKGERTYRINSVASPPSFLARPALPRRAFLLLRNGWPVVAAQGTTLRRQGQERTGGQPAERWRYNGS